MTGTLWRYDEVVALINLAREGKSAAQIAVALGAQGSRNLSYDSVRKKIRRLRAEGVDVPLLQGQPGRTQGSRKPKPKAAKLSVAPAPRKRSTTAGRQRQSILGIMANSAYQPASVIAGFPTIQIRKDREGNPLAPVTLRRVDLSGACA